MNDDTSNTASPPADPDAVAAQLDSEEVGLAQVYEGIPTIVKLGVAFGALIVVAVVFAIWHNFYWHWFEVHSGTVNESGPYYGFWSGFGSDLGEATIVVGIVATWRHHNCHVKGCARLGRKVDGTPYLACPKHHPDHKGYKRNVTLEELHVAHKRARTSKD